METVTNNGLLRRLPRRQPLDARRRHTDNPFTVAVCTACGTDVTAMVMPKLRQVVRNCPHGVLVVTNCLLGTFACGGKTSAGPGNSGREVMLVLQPCTRDRAPVSSMQWIGPVRDEVDADAVCQWIASGEWDPGDLPTNLRAELHMARLSRSN